MTDSRRTLTDKLLRALGSAASYNDKGYLWSGHDEAQQAAFRSRLQAEILQLSEQIGQVPLGADLFQALISGAAVHDALGDYVQRVRERLGAGDRY
jgi:hypothetical protein